MKKLYLILAVAFLLSCAPGVDEGSPFHLIEGTYKPPYKPPYEPPIDPPHLIEYGAIIDNRDDNRYRTTEIGNHIWMADNLNYNIIGSTCYENQDSYCKIYGRLYTWEAAMSACPEGWHLSNNVEWEDLVKVVGGEKVAGRYLKEIKGWEERGNGRNSYGFAALPGGDSNGDTFFGVGIYGNWWSSDATQINVDYIIKTYYIMNYSYDDVMNVNDINIGDRLFSVRCVQDLLMSQDDE